MTKFVKEAAHREYLWLGQTFSV